MFNIKKIIFVFLLTVAVYGQRQNVIRFKGTGAPGAVIQSRYGDVYLDSNTFAAYVCTDPLSFCSGVSSGEWSAMGASGGTGITSLNALIASSQSFATGTTGTDFNIVSSGATHTFHLPTASASNRGALSTSDWTTFNNKLGDPGANGCLGRTSAGTTVARTFSVGSAKLTVSNGNCVAGNPTFDLGSVASTDLSDTANIVRKNAANTYTAGFKQTFTPDATNSGINVGSRSGDPSAGVNGDMYYDTGTNKFRCYQNGAWADCIGTGGGGGLNDPGANGAIKRTALNTTAPAQATDMSAPNHCADAGATDSYACNLSPVLSAYTTRDLYWFTPNTINTGAATLNLNSLGAKTIKKYKGGSKVDLDNGDIRAGKTVLVIYDGTDMVLQAPPFVATDTALNPNTNSPYFYVRTDVSIPTSQCGTFSAGVSGGGLILPCFGDGVVSDRNLAYTSGQVAESRKTVGQAVTANLLVEVDTTGSQQVKLAALSSTGVTGVALYSNTGVGTEFVGVVTHGYATCVVSGSPSAGDLVIPSSTTAGRCAGAGTATLSSVSPSTQVIGIWITTAGAGNPGTILLFGTKMFGTNYSTSNLSDNANIVKNNQNNTYSAGTKQTMGPNGTSSGLNVGSHTADPGTPANGDIFYNSTSGKFRCYQAGAWSDCIGSGSGSGKYVLASTATAAVNVAASTTTYQIPVGIATAFSTEANRRVMLPESGTASKICAVTTSTQNAAGSLVITFRINGVDSSLVLTIAGGSVAGTYCSTTSPATITANDVVSYQITNNYTGGNSAGITMISSTITN